MTRDPEQIRSPSPRHLNNFRRESQTRASQRRGHPPRCTHHVHALPPHPRRRRTSLRRLGTRQSYSVCVCLRPPSVSAVARKRGESLSAVLAPLALPRVGPNGVTARFRSPRRCFARSSSRRRRWRCCEPRDSHSSAHGAHVGAESSPFLGRRGCSGQHARRTRPQGQWRDFRPHQR